MRNGWWAHAVLICSLEGKGEKSVIKHFKSKQSEFQTVSMFHFPTGISSPTPFGLSKTCDFVLIHF